jgi:hypothetical protein
MVLLEKGAAANKKIISKILMTENLHIITP